MSITGYTGKLVMNGTGKIVTIDNEKDLYTLGATYGVVKLVKDKPHWSDDGH